MIRFIISLVIVTWLLSFFHTFLQNIGLGQLPGDLYIENGDSKFYLPLATSFVTFCGLKLITWIISKL